MTIKMKNVLMVLMCLVILLPILNSSGINNVYATYEANVTPGVSESSEIQENQQNGLPTYYCEGNLVDFSSSGSSIRLECGHSGYAWQHIWLKHLMGLHPEEGSRFRSSLWTQREMLKQIAMEIINKQSLYVRESPTKITKRAWSTYNNSDVKVVLSDTGRVNGNGGTAWNFITVYPIY